MTEERLKKALEIAANVATLHREESERTKEQLERYKRMYREAKKDAEYWRQRYEDLNSKIERFMRDVENGTSKQA